MNVVWEKYLAAALQKTFSLDYEFSSLLARYLRTIRAFYEEDLEIRKELLEYWPKHPSMFNTCKHNLQGNWLPLARLEHYYENVSLKIYFFNFFPTIYYMGI